MRKLTINGKYLILEGFKNVKIKNLQTIFSFLKTPKKDCYIQLFNAEVIAGFDHLYFACLNALKAFEQGKNISKDLAVETLLYASGQHQINKAIQMLGVTQETKDIAVLIVSEKPETSLEALEKTAHLLRGEQCDRILCVTKKKMQNIKSTLNIKETELRAAMRDSEEQALTNLLIERAALLAAQT
ncbi:MAG: KEOPS complex subunit Cgi121 [Candidatus Bathyarchaeia archaeon]